MCHILGIISNTNQTKSSLFMKRLKNFVEELSLAGLCTSVRLSGYIYRLAMLCRDLAPLRLVPNKHECHMPLISLAPYHSQPWVVYRLLQHIHPYGWNMICSPQQIKWRQSTLCNKRMYSGLLQMLSLAREKNIVLGDRSYTLMVT